MAHFQVFMYPGPDGVRPSVLAERASITKQALNQLLKSLEASGYLFREDAANGSSGRVIRLTSRGREVAGHIFEELARIEEDWSRQLGPERYAQLKGILRDVWHSPLVE